MKVLSHTIEAYARTTVSPVGGARPVESAPEIVSSEAAHVTVSDEARALAQKSANYDEKKVATLKAQVASGEFKVNPQTVATRLLDSFG